MVMMIWLAHLPAASTRCPDEIDGSGEVNPVIILCFPEFGAQSSRRKRVEMIWKSYLCISDALTIVPRTMSHISDLLLNFVGIDNESETSQRNLRPVL